MLLSQQQNQIPVKVVAAHDHNSWTQFIEFVWTSSGDIQIFNTPIINWMVFHMLILAHTLPERVGPQAFKFGSQGSVWRFVPSMSSHVCKRTHQDVLPVPQRFFEWGRLTACADEELWFANKDRGCCTEAASRDVALLSRSHVYKVVEIQCSNITGRQIVGLSRRYHRHSIG